MSECFPAVDRSQGETLCVCPSREGRPQSLSQPPTPCRVPRGQPGASRGPTSGLLVGGGAGYARHSAPSRAREWGAGPAGTLPSPHAALCCFPAVTLGSRTRHPSGAKCQGTSHPPRRGSPVHDGQRGGGEGRAVAQGQGWPLSPCCVMWCLLREASVSPPVKGRRQQPKALGSLCRKTIRCHTHRLVTPRGMHKQWASCWRDPLTPNLEASVAMAAVRRGARPGAALGSDSRHTVPEAVSCLD